MLTAIIWGTAFVFQRVGMDKIEPVTFTASRMTLAAIAVGLISGLHEKRPAFETPEQRKSYSRNTIAGGICCGSFLASASIFQQIGIVYSTAGKAGFITALYILIVPVISFVLFRKRGTWLTWVAVLMGVTGMYLLCVNESLHLAQGDMLLLICAVLFSGHILCCGYFAGRGDPLRISAIQFTTTAIISWSAAFIMESPHLGKIMSAAVPILYCGVISGGVGYTLQIIAQEYTDTTVASLLMSLESVFAAIAGALILSERMSARELLGCAIMFSAIMIVQAPVKNMNQETK